jgi:DNA-binding response OmpR family regulator
MPDNKKEFLSKGLTDYLSKPFLINELNDLVKKLIYKKQ